MAQETNLQITRNAAGTSFVDSPVAPAIGAIGNTVYFGVWDDGAGLGDAPLATAGPFVVGR